MSLGAATYRVWIVVLLGLALACPRLTAASSGEDVPVSSRFASTWKEIDKLLAEDKLEEALPKVEALAGAARAAGDEETWTRALVQATWLRAGLHKPEDAVRFLREQPRPSGPLHRAVVDLYYAETLVRYLQARGREVDQRETVEAAGDPPLERQTRRQIAAAALAACRDAWSRRREIGEVPLAPLRPYLQPNSSPYPEAVRGTARDVLSYLYAELLANRSLWSSEDAAADSLTLDLPALIRGDVMAGEVTAAHPVQEMATVLGDLEAWHLAAGRREAALEARRTRLLLLHGAFRDEEDRRLILRDLQERLDGFRDVPWWSMGMATLADLLRTDGGARSPRPGACRRRRRPRRLAGIAGRRALPVDRRGDRAARLPARGRAMAMGSAAAPSGCCTRTSRRSTSAPIESNPHRERGTSAIGRPRRRSRS